MRIARAAMQFTAGSLILLLSSFALAQEKPAEEQQEEGQVEQLLKSFFAPARTSTHQRIHSSVLSAFRETVSGPRNSTAIILAGEKRVALATIVSADGYLLTKASELSGGDLKCLLPGGKKTSLKILGSSSDYDLAMIKVDAKDLTPVVWSETEPLLGSLLATPGLGEDPVSVGVVSNLPREISAPSGVLGILLDQGDLGPRVQEVLDDSGAKKAGMQVDDVITRVNGKEVKTREELIATIRRYKPGDKVSLSVKREDKVLMIEATLGSREEGSNRQSIQNNLGGKLSDRSSGFPLALQHDSVLRPEDCGGPLVNLDGQAVGINIARAGRVVSYAIPAKAILPLIPQLKEGKLAGPDARQVLQELAEKLTRLEEQEKKLAAELAPLQKVEADAQAEIAKAEESVRQAQAALEAARQDLQAAQANMQARQDDLVELRTAISYARQEREAIEQETKE